MKNFIIFVLTFSIFFNVNLKAFAQDLNVAREPVLLQSRLKGDYNGYKYTITNKSDGDLELVNATITNGQDGAIASDVVADGSGVGTMWAIMGPAGLVSFGITWLVGIVATPIMLVTDKMRNSKARKEGLNFNNLVDLGLLPAGQSTEVNTLIRKGAQPQLKITYKSPSSSELKFIAD